MTNSFEQTTDVLTAQEDRRPQTLEPDNALAPKSPISEPIRGRQQTMRLALIALGPFVPIVVEFFVNLYRIPNYDFFPMALAAAAFLIWHRMQGFSGWLPGYSRFGIIVLGVSYLGLIAGTLLMSPWIGYFSFLIACVGFVHILGGYGLLRRLLPIGLLLLTVLPPPFGLDRKFILLLQSFATSQASHVLDSLDIAHAVEGNIISLTEKQLFVEEACSGIHSLTSVIVVTMILMIWLERPWLHSLLMLASGFIWVLAANTLRIVLIAVAREWYQTELAAGKRHFLLGVGLFGLMMGLVISTDCLLRVFYRQFEDQPQVLRPSSAKRVGRVRFAGYLAMALGAACFVIGVIKLLPLEPKTDITKYPLAIGDDVMPLKFRNWSRQEGNEGKVKESKRTTMYDFGDFSSTWYYESGRWKAMVSFDYPFRAWHDLTECYAGSGWFIVDRTLQTSENGRYFVVNLKHPERGDARLFYTLIMADGGSPEPPASGVSSWLRGRINLLEFQSDNKVSYQVQTLLHGPTLPSVEVNNEALSLFQHSVQTMREFLRQPKGP